MKMTFLAIVPETLVRLFNKATPISVHQAVSTLGSRSILLGAESALHQVREQLEFPNCNLMQPESGDRECPIPGDEVVLFIHDENFRLIRQGLRRLEISDVANSPLWQPSGERNPVLRVPSSS